MARQSNPSAVGITGVGGFLQGRIAKPLRGGGGTGVENLAVNGTKGYVPGSLSLFSPTESNVRPLASVQENGQTSRRSSWFFDRR